MPVFFLSRAFTFSRVSRPQIRQFIFLGIRLFSPLREKSLCARTLDLSVPTRASELRAYVLPAPSRALTASFRVSARVEKRLLDTLFFASRFGPAQKRVCHRTQATSGTPPSSSSSCRAVQRLLQSPTATRAPSACSSVLCPSPQPLFYLSVQFLGSSAARPLFAYIFCALSAVPGDTARSPTRLLSVRTSFQSFHSTDCSSKQVKVEFSLLLSQRIRSRAPHPNRARVHASRVHRRHLRARSLPYPLIHKPYPFTGQSLNG